MRIGIFGGTTANGPIDMIVDAARATHDDGFASFWLPQVFGVDALTVLAVWEGLSRSGLFYGEVIPSLTRIATSLA